MGFGDEIMASGNAYWLWKEKGKRVMIVDKNNKARWHALWSGNEEFMVNPHKEYGGVDCVRYTHGSSARPYIDYNNTTKERWAYTDQGIYHPGILHVEPHQASHFKDKMREGVVIEPHLKPNASPNKQWGWKNWQQLVRMNPNVDWIQLGPKGTKLLKGVRHVHTDNFYTAIAAMAGARAAVLPEGGLHHVAASLGIQAIVIFGGMTSPKNTGYDSHVNLFVPEDGSPCGWRIPCIHCKRAMKTIQPEIVDYHVSLFN